MLWLFPAFEREMEMFGLPRGHGPKMNAAHICTSVCIFSKNVRSTADNGHMQCQCTHTAFVHLRKTRLSPFVSSRLYAKLAACMHVSVHINLAVCPIEAR